MIEDHLEDLIHRDIDGELSADEKAQLEQQLARSSEARAAYARQQRLAHILDRVETVDSPRELKAAVLSTIDASPPTSASAGIQPRVARPRRTAPVRLRDAVGFLAGAAAAVLAFTMLGRGPLIDAIPESQLSGSMLPRTPSAAWAEAAREQIREDWADATAVLRGAGSHYQLDLQVETSDVTEISVDFDPRAWSAVDLRSSSPPPASLQFDDGRLRVRQSGAGHYIVEFEHIQTDQGDDSLTLVLRSDQGRVERTLTARPARR